MRRRRLWKTAALTGLATLAGLALPAPAAAHCDSMDGPVVKAARKALDTGRVELALIWVRAEDEPEIRRAFERATAVRKSGGAAGELADLWFFETLVRLHREGEGAPYTGLKPAGYEPPSGIAAADRALEAGEVDELATSVAERAAAALRQKYAHVAALRDRDPGDVEAGRRYVHAYVDYIHFVEELHGLLHGSGEPHLHDS